MIHHNLWSINSKIFSSISIDQHPLVPKDMAVSYFLKSCPQSLRTFNLKSLTLTKPPCYVPLISHTLYRQLHKLFIQDVNYHLQLTKQEPNPKITFSKILTIFAVSYPIPLELTVTHTLAITKQLKSRTTTSYFSSPTRMLLQPAPIASTILFLINHRSS